MTVPFASGLFPLTTSCTEPVPPAARVPRFQVTTPPDSVPPAVADTNDVLAGSVSRTTTPVASAVPLLVYVSWYVRFAPAPTGSGATGLVMLMTGEELTVVVSAAPLV